MGIIGSAFALGCSIHIRSISLRWGMVVQKGKMDIHWTLLCDCFSCRAALDALSPLRGIVRRLGCMKMLKGKGLDRDVTVNDPESLD